MIQIIGKGGFGRELAAYCEANNIPYSQFQNECLGLRSNMDAVIAIGNEESRSVVFEMFPNQSWGKLLLGKVYGDSNKIMPGSIICPGTILTVNTFIGPHCLININCSIGHDVVIGGFTTINPGVNISGNVVIGSNCNIGSNAVIKQGIKVCDDVTIGAGSVIVKDITEPGIYIGNPATRMDKRQLPLIIDSINDLQRQITELQTQISNIRSSNKEIKYKGNANS